MLRARNAIQSTDIKIKMLKENADIFEDYICLFLNKCVHTGTFPDILKHANITPVFKKECKTAKDITTGQRVFYQLSPKNLQNYYLKR